MKKISIALASIALGLSSSISFAGETGAGCGIGKVIMDGKSGKSQNIVAAILNDILIPRSFFMTTGAFVEGGVLGCDPTQTVMREEEKASFVAVNMDNLSSDIAQGQGAHLDALASVMGIAEDDKSTFFSMTQEEYPSLFSDGTADAQALMTSLNNAMAQHPDLAKYIR